MCLTDNLKIIFSQVLWSMFVAVYLFRLLAYLANGPISNLNGLSHFLIHICT